MKYGWEHYASLSRDYARQISTGYEALPDGTRYTKVCDIQDINASKALTLKFKRYGSVASVHTWPGGKQEIRTTHTDGTHGLFNTDGVIEGTDKQMDKDVEAYIKSGDAEGAGDSMVLMNEDEIRGLVSESIGRVREKLLGNRKK